MPKNGFPAVYAFNAINIDTNHNDEARTTKKRQQQTHADQLLRLFSVILFLVSYPCSCCCPLGVSGAVGGCLGHSQGDALGRDISERLHRVLGDESLLRRPLPAKVPCLFVRSFVVFSSHAAPFFFAIRDVPTWLASAVRPTIPPPQLPPPQAKRNHHNTTTTTLTATTAPILHCRRPNHNQHNYNHHPNHHPPPPPIHQNTTNPTNATNINIDNTNTNANDTTTTTTRPQPPQPQP